MAPQCLTPEAYSFLVLADTAVALKSHRTIKTYLPKKRCLTAMFRRSTSLRKVPAPIAEPLFTRPPVTRRTKPNGIRCFTYNTAIVKMKPHGRCKDVRSEEHTSE